MVNDEIFQKTLKILIILQLISEFGVELFKFAIII